MRAALAALPGARHIAVDFDKKQAIVTIAQNDYDEEKLIPALKDAGFGGSIKGTRQLAPTRGDGDQSDAPSNGNGLVPPTPGISGDLSATDTDQTTYSPAGFGKHLKVSTHLDHDVLRPGDSFRLAVVFDIEKGWHIYGNPIGPGIGKETVLSVEGPEGFRFDPARYTPAEKAEQDFGEAGKTWVWEHTGKTIHYLSGAVRSDATPGEYQWTVRASAQVCTEKTCLPGVATVPLKVTVRPQGSPAQAINLGDFADFAASKPPPVDESY